jgi:hypothetical protein
VRIYYQSANGLEEVLYDDNWVSYNTSEKKFTVTNQFKIPVLVELR